MELVAMQYHGRSNKHFSYMYCTLTNSSLESQILIWVQIESIAADRSKLQSSSICKSVIQASSQVCHRLAVDKSTLQPRARPADHNQ